MYDVLLWLVMYDQLLLINGEKRMLGAGLMGLALKRCKQTHARRSEYPTNEREP